MGGAGGRGGPDEGGVVAGEGEEGDGAGGEEALVGCCVVVYLWSGGGVGIGVRAGAETHCGYHAVAVVVPASGGDVGEASDRAVEAVGAYKEARGE